MIGEINWIQKSEYLYQVASLTYQKLHVDNLVVSLSVDFQLMNPNDLLSLYTIFDSQQNHLFSFVLGVTHRRYALVIFAKSTFALNTTFLLLSLPTPMKVHILIIELAQLIKKSTHVYLTFLPSILQDYL